MSAAGGAGLFQSGSHPDQGFVSLQMTVVVVDLLEMIHIHHQQKEIICMRMQLVGEISVEVLAVVDLGQLIDHDLPVGGAYIQAEELDRDTDTEDRHMFIGETQKPGNDQAQREACQLPALPDQYRIVFPPGGMQDPYICHYGAHHKEEDQQMKVGTAGVDVVITDGKQQMRAVVGENQKDGQNQGKEQQKRLFSRLEGVISQFRISIYAPKVHACAQQDKGQGFEYPWDAKIR